MQAPAENIILRELLAAEPGWVSGAALAERLGVSRVSVWNHMERLRGEGFTFEAQASRGYRIASRPAALHAGLVQAQLQVNRRAFTFEVLDEVDSTNDEAARQLAAGRQTPFAIFARRQTRGRGRFGRPWHSASDSNLYASFAFRPQVAPARMHTFTLWMGVILCNLVSRFTPVAPGIKWPNDIVFGARKAGGILTEARVDADQIRDLVLGLGLNVNSPAGGWPAELAPRAVSLAEIAGAPVDINRLTAALTGRVLLAYEKFEEGSHGGQFSDLWTLHDTLMGRRVALLEGGRRHAGTAAGIDDEGSLLLRDGDGSVRRFRAGEVTVEKGA